MAVQLESNVKEDLKTQFATREGTYRLMTLSEYSRPNRVGYTNTQSSPQVRVSIVSLPFGQQSQSPCQRTSTNRGTSTSSIESRLGAPVYHNDQKGAAQVHSRDHICFNFGKELYVYAYRGVKKDNELNKPVDKKLYKGTNPSCHDFNATSATVDGAPLLVGFTTGQIQLVQPGRREPGKLYNEERLIDKTKVTCLKWLPGSPTLFLASHASGNLYLYNEELPCTTTVPNYQPFKMGDGYTILTCKSKTTINPLYKWVFGTENCSINEFNFSPCGSNLAIVSQDGFLRVFHYDTMELLGIARSYFGGFLCVCWSPDGKYIVVGGEDDLVTVWSLQERRVVARGQGHRSWVSVVAFDPYTTSYANWDGADLSDDENPIADNRYVNNDGNYETMDGEKNVNGCRPSTSILRNSITTQEKLATSYRLGSVSQDTQLCLWDITEDILRHPLTLRQRVNSTSDIEIQINGEVMNNINVTKPTSSANSNSTNSNKENGGCNNSSKNNSKSNSSKFSATNCSIPPLNVGGICNLIAESTNKKNTDTNTINKQSSSVSKQANYSNVGNNIIIPSDTKRQLSNEISNKSSSGNSKSADNSGILALNNLTQKFSNFNFGSDKKSSEDRHNHNRHNHHHKKTFSFSKSSGSCQQPTVHNSFSTSNAESNANGNSLKTVKSLQLSAISSYDPMKLIGTPACPRFDECPLLEPLVCKKIAHERLTALIFREDCFLTACQDGFIYTWARPGFSNVPQYMPPSPGAPSGGTVV